MAVLLLPAMLPPGSPNLARTRLQLPDLVLAACRAPPARTRAPAKSAAEVLQALVFADMRRRCQSLLLNEHAGSTPPRRAGCNVFKR